MSPQTGIASIVIATCPVLPVADNKFLIASSFTTFLAAPTVANTSVSRQTGLAGIWNQSFDPASLTQHPQSRVASTMRNNTLVVCTKNSLAKIAALRAVVDPDAERRLSTRPFVSFTVSTR